MDASEYNQITQIRHPGSPYPKPVQRRLEYDVDGNPVYIAWAPSVATDAQGRWCIEKLEYDGSGRYVKSTFTGIQAAWDNRALETYV